MTSSANRTAAESMLLHETGRNHHDIIRSPISYETRKCGEYDFVRNHSQGLGVEPPNVERDKWCPQFDMKLAENNEIVEMLEYDEREEHHDDEERAEVAQEAELLVSPSTTRTPRTVTIKTPPKKSPPGSSVSSRDGGNKKRASELGDEEAKDELGELGGAMTPRTPRRIKIIHVDKEPSGGGGPMKPSRPFQAARNSRDESFQQRVNRFLSVWEIPPHEVTFSMPTYDMTSAKSRTTTDGELSGAEEERVASPQHVTKRKYSMLSHDYRTNIIREIIKNYDQEKFLDQYRSMSVVEVKLEKNKPEVVRQRERLLKLMKSDTIRLNDVNYMNELSERLQENLRLREEKRIEEMAEREKKRERRLILKGLIEEEYDIRRPPSEAAAAAADVSRKSSRKSLSNLE